MPRRFIRAFVPVALACAVVGAVAAGEPSRKAVADLFRSDRIGQLALSPDGTRLAHTVREGNAIWLMIRDLDRADHDVSIRVEPDATAGVFRRTTTFAVQFPFVAWPDNQHLVYAITLPPEKLPWREEVHVVDADGRNDRKLIDSEFIEATYVPPEPLPPLNAPPDAPLPEPPPSIPVSRRMHVLGLVSAPGPSVLVEAMGTRLAETELYRVPLGGGRPAAVASEDAADRYLFGWDGRARVRETGRVRMPPLGSGPPPRGMPRPEPMIVPQRVYYRAGDDGRGAWREFDASLAFTHADADFYGHRSLVLGVDADPRVLYFASNVGRDTYAVYGFDTVTRRRTALAVESADADLVDPAASLSARVLVFTRDHRLAGVRVAGAPGTTRWLDPELSRVQTLAEQRFRERRVDLLDWSDDKRRALLLVTGSSEPGRYFLWREASPPEFVELLRRNPGVTAEGAAATVRVAFDGGAGVKGTGLLTLPPWSRRTPPPLVVYCSDIPGAGPPTIGFEPKFQALAAQGYMVLAVNYRGLGGLGAAHRDAARAGFDRVPLEDVRAALQWVWPRYPYDRRRVALVGEGFGGYLALRGLELYPAEFRCGVSVNGPADLVTWVLDPQTPNRRAGAPIIPSEAAGQRQAFFGRDARGLEAISVITAVDRLTRPVLILEDPQRPDAASLHGATLRDRLSKLGREPEYAAIPGLLARANAEASARVLLRIGAFLNANLYEYRVDVGPEREVK